MAEHCDDLSEDIDETFEDELTKEFEKAAVHLPQVLAKVSVPDVTLLYLYARYKQATEGQCSTNRPGLFEFQAKKKWDAWNSIKDKHPDEAKSEYVAKIRALDPDWTVEVAVKPKASWNSVSTMAIADEDTLPDDKKTPFDWCQDGKLVPLKRSIKQSEMDINETDELGLTLLHWSCDRGHTEITKYLIQNKADINSIDTEGQTPLHYACACGHPNIVKILLENKANVKITDTQGDTALQVCEDDEVRKMVSSWVF